ncbi:MAG: Pvc16 family protein [Oscillospiraceae bacterium]
MTEYTAIYEAGESLAALLRSELTPEPVAKKEHIGLCEPQSPEDFQLTIWIYNIETVKDSGTRTGFQPDPDDPSQERFAPMQMKLHALISAHSKAPAIQKCADEYRILGRAMQVVRDVPSIPPEHLVGSLAEQTEPVLLEIIKLNGEELSRCGTIPARRYARPLRWTYRRFSCSPTASGALLRALRLRSSILILPLTER